MKLHNAFDNLSPKSIQMFIDITNVVAKQSTANKYKVGCIVVKENRIISIGYNGTPPGWDNQCEDLLEDGSLLTRDEVIHAEANAITKLASSNDSGKDAVLFCTHNPCLSCAKLIAGSGISGVIYTNIYDNERTKIKGIDYLYRCGIGIQQY